MIIWLRAPRRERSVDLQLRCGAVPLCGSSPVPRPAAVNVRFADGTGSLEIVAFVKFVTYCNEEASVGNAAVAQAHISIEALAAHVAAQNKKPSHEA